MSERAPAPAPNSSVTTLTTNPAGYYSFTTALAGVHKVAEVQQSGWVQSSPIVQFCIDTTGNVSHGPLDFGNYEECDESEITTTQYNFGFADNTGVPGDNRWLGDRRAKAVRDALAAKGVEPVKSSIETKAARSPRDDNAKQSGRERNRRVSIRITY